MGCGQSGSWWWSKSGTSLPRGLLNRSSPRSTPCGLEIIRGDPSGGDQLQHKK